MHIAVNAWLSGRPVLLAALAVVIIGLGSSFMTWRTIQEQNETVERHTELTAKLILRGAERHLGRGLMKIHDMHSAMWWGDLMMPDIHLPDAGSLFQELVDKGDVVFISLYDSKGKEIMSSLEGGEDSGEINATSSGSRELKIPQEAMDALKAGHDWRGYVRFAGKKILVYGSRTHSELAHMCDFIPNCLSGNSSMPIPPPWVIDELLRKRFAEDQARMSPPEDGKPGALPEAMRGEADNRMDVPAAESNREFEAALFIGLNVDEHVALLEKFKRNAVLQTVYTVSVGVILLILAAAYLKRKGRERKILILEQFHSKLLDNMPDGLIMIDDSGLIVAANTAVERILRPEDGRLAGKSWKEVKKLVCSDGTHNDGCDRESEWVQVEIDNRKLEVLSLPVASDSEGAHEGRATGQGRLVLFRDRTEIAALEDDLAEARRLAAFGRLAAGIAHEIRNPLSSLRGFAQFFAGKLAGKKPEESYAQMMVREADRLNRVVEELLYLARPRASEIKQISLSELGRELAALLDMELANKGAILNLNFREDSIPADYNSMKQALLNLILNSLAACAQGTGRVEIGSFLRDGSVYVTVRDNGGGMTEEEREHAFEPFFSRREGGTGLGLAVVEKIVREHKGRVEIKSQSGSGTEVIISLPVRRGE